MWKVRLSGNMELTLFVNELHSIENYVDLTEEKEPITS